MATQYINNMTALWNVLGTTYTAIKMNITNAASAADSKLIELEVGAVDKFVVDRSGNVVAAGTTTSAGLISSGVVTPATNDGAALGSTTLKWSDLFLADGSVINFSGGDVTITHSLDALAFNGATSGYYFGNTVRPLANDGSALGTATASWSDLFLATGALINYANGNWVATHTSGILTVTTGDLRVTTAGVNPASVVTVGGTQTLTAKTLTSPTVSGGTVNGTPIGGTTPSTGSFTTLNSTGGALNGTIGATTPAAGSFTTVGATSITAATVTGTNVVADTAATPDIDNGASLGTGLLGWSNLFLASGGIVYWGNGDVTLTHSADVLTVTGGDLKIATPGVTATSAVTVGGTQTLTNKTITGATITGVVTPVVNDGSALGTTSLGWSDLYLATGGVIDWGSGNVTITQSTNTLSFAGADSGYFFDFPPRPLTNNGVALGLSGGAWSDLFLGDGGIINWNAGNVTLTHSTGALTLSTGDLRVTTAGVNAASVVTVGGNQTLTNKALTSPAFNTAANPSSNDSATLGTSLLRWSDLYLATGSVISMGGVATLTESSGALRFGGNVEMASSTSISWGTASNSTLFASGSNGSNLDIFAAGTLVINSIGAMTLGGSDVALATTAGTSTTSVVTCGDTQTLSNKKIQFPATQVPSSDAHTLDDYEEGTITTPQLRFGTAFVGMTESVSQTTYVKIGKLVSFTLLITLTAKGSSTGSANIINALPYTCSAGYVAFSVAYLNMTSATGLSANNGGGSGTTISLGLGSATDNQNVAFSTNFTNNTELVISGSYIATA